MNILFTLAFNSLLSRKTSVILTIISLTLSITLFVIIDNFKGGAKKNFFSNAQTGDLILAAKSGEIQSLLYILFQIGTPSGNITWTSFQNFKKHEDVEWIIPISLGDSHKQFRVLGTNSEYFEKITFKNKHLEFFDGKKFENVFDVVIGHDVSTQLQYKLKDDIIIAHGISSQSLHEEFPFKVSGILKKTGSPADKLVYVSLEALEAIHNNWKSGSRIRKLTFKTTIKQKNNITPKEITGAIIKLKSKIKIFKFQREVSNFQNEPLQAIIPGLTLSKLWQVISFIENILIIISFMVVISSLIGISAVLYSNIHLRKSEIALLRIVGASPKKIYQLLVMESFIISFMSIFLSILIVQILTFILFPIFDYKYGVYMEYNFLSSNNIVFYFTIIILSLLISLFPGYRVFKTSLIEGI